MSRQWSCVGGDMQLAFDVRSHQERLLDQIGFVLTVTLLRALSLLPYGLVRLGSAIGTILHVLPSRRENIVLANLRLCFPEKTEREYDELARNHFPPRSAELSRARHSVVR
jgi:lauroyl/myristoyl acyltransferase